MQRYEQIKCRVCGGELKEQESGIYKCDYCGAKFERIDIEQYIKAIRLSLRGEVNDALAEQRNSDIGAARQNLYVELKAEHVNSYNVISCCRKLKEYLPEDFQANVFEVLNSGTKEQINKCLGNVDEKGVGRYYIKDILDFMLKSLVKENELSLKSLADRALSGEEKTRYLNDIEEEAKKYDEGIYNPKIPRKAFIAYSSKDMSRVNEIVNYLEDSGISCFVALRNMRHGRGAVENYGEILKKAMHYCKCFVFLSSRNSRRLDCDAIDMELPYIRDNEPQVKRIEYILEDYGAEESGGVKAILKDFFGTSEQCRDKNDLVRRIFSATTQKHAADNNEELQKQVEEYKRQFEEEAERRRKELDEEYKKKEEELKKREEEQRQKFETKNSQNDYPTISNYDKSKFEIEGTTLKKYLVKDTEVQIPQGVTTIGNNAFYGCSSLESIDIPKSVIEIKDDAFSYCINLSSIKFYKGLIRIGDRVFSHCKNLINITIPQGVKFIGAGAFGVCSKLENIIIPDSVKEIGERAFVECTSMKKIIIPYSVTKMGDDVFIFCNLTIYCRRRIKPLGWKSTWRRLCKVVWGYKGK